MVSTFFARIILHLYQCGIRVLRCVKHIFSVSGKVMPNPSIERTSPGKPGLASHVKR